MTQITPEEDRARFQGSVIILLLIVVALEGACIAAMWPHIIMAEARSQHLQEFLIEKGIYP